jgi:hypothetical protein
LIKITGLSKHLDNVVFTVTYSTPDGEDATLSKEVKATIVADMTVEQVKAQIIQAVEKARADSVEAKIQAFLAPLLNVDLEAPA